MKKHILILFCLLSTSLFAQNVEWAHTLGGPGRDQPQSIKSDQAGNVFVAGTFVGTPISFSDSDIVLHGSDSTDIYLYKRSPSGELLWANVLTSPGHEHVNAIAVDSEGNVFIAGWFRKPLVLGTPGSQITLTSSAGQDGFIAKYDSNGQLLMAYPLGGPYKDEVLTLSFDQDDNLVLSGRFIGEVDFDFSDASHIVHSSGLTFLKLTRDLEFISVFNLNTNKAFPSKVVFNADGEMIFAGRYQGTLQWPTGGGVLEPSNGLDGGFVMKIDTNNEFLWSVAITGPIFQMVTDMHVSQSGEIYITGDFTKSTYFRSNPSYHIFQTDSESRDIFFAKLSTSGNFDWVKIIGGPLFDEVAGIAEDANGNIVLAGRYAGTIDIDPSLATVEMTAQGNAATFIATYTASGEYITARSIQNASHSVGSEIALSPTNEIYVTGWFTESIDFDSTQPDLAFSSNGVQDTYLIKLGAVSVGLNDNLYKPEISIFPNPANEQVKIKAAGLEKIECFDMHGKLVLSKSPGFRQNEHTLNVSHLPAGIYFIRLRANNQISFTEKLVIIR